MENKRNGTSDLKTNRLMLRKFTVYDTDNMYKNWASDPDVTKYVSWDTHETPEFTRTLLVDWVENYKNDENYNWAIVLMEKQEVIGSIGTVPSLTPSHCAEIGYCIGKNWWGQGITAEALAEVIAYLFQEGYYRLQARHNILNVNSGRVMEKCGMKFEGVLRAGSYVKEQYVDTPMYSILKDD